jgi:hypothetical protein
MSANEKSFQTLANTAVWYHLRDEPNKGDERIVRKRRTYYCTNKLHGVLENCFQELFQIWPLGAPKAILTMGTLGDGENSHGKGNAFDLSGFELADGTVLRVFDYDESRLLSDGINVHLFLFFPQVLNHFYPNHRDRFHADFNFEDRNRYRPGSKAQTFFIQSVLRNAFDKDLGSSGRYDDGIDGVYGASTRAALDEVFFDLGLAGSGGLGIEDVWRVFVIHARNHSFQRYLRDQRIAGGDAGPFEAVAFDAAREFGILRDEVYNRGRPPAEFLNELIDWAISADDEVFTRNENFDIYSKIAADLGPWQSLRHRKAAMCEVLRVLGGFESSWNWNEGRDMSANNTDHDTTEGGIFQCASNSMYFFRNDPYIEEVFNKLGIRERGPQRSRRFLEVMKSDHEFAFEYTARLIRHTLNHHGPLKYYNGRIYQGRRHDGVGDHVSRSAVNEFLSFL